MDIPIPADWHELGAGVGIAGALLLFAVLWFRSNLKSMKSHMDAQSAKLLADGGIDARNDRLSDHLLEALGLERERNSALVKELSHSHEQYRTLLTSQTEMMNHAIDRVRAESRDSIHDLRQQVKQCELQHAQCRETVQAIVVERQTDKAEFHAFKDLVSNTIHNQKAPQVNVKMVNPTSGTPAIVVAAPG